MNCVIRVVSSWQVEALSSILLSPTTTSGPGLPEVLPGCTSSASSVSMRLPEGQCLSGQVPAPPTLLISRHPAPRVYDNKKLGGSVVALEDLLGSGCGGFVRKGRMDDTPVAIKTVTTSDAGKRQQFINEVEVLALAGQCPHLIDWLAICVSPHSHSVHIVMEFMNLGSLSDLIARHMGEIPPMMIGSFMHKSLLGLHFLHQRAFMHRDIKPANILHSRDGSVKLSDYGLAKFLDDLCHSQAGTTMYFAPERICGEAYGHAADIWGMGLVLHELADGYPFSGRDIFTLWSEICEGCGPSLPAKFPDNMVNFHSRCLQKAPEARHTTSMLLESDFILKSASTSQLACWLQKGVCLSVVFVFGVFGCDYLPCFQSTTCTNLKLKHPSLPGYQAVILATALLLLIAVLLACVGCKLESISLDRTSDDTQLRLHRLGSYSATQLVPGRHKGV